MDPCPPSDLCGWVSGPDTRGTLGIIYSSLSTIWLCTWTSLCLNIPDSAARGWRFQLYKFRWQLFAILFPEVLVATAAEQWVSARQSVDAFARLGWGSWWSTRHGFYADMGGILVTSRCGDVFPVNGFHLAYLVEHQLLPMPHISPDDIRAVNKADGLARAFTLVQMGWFCLACVGKALGRTELGRIGLAPIELETLTFILSTLHTFFFWYHKPLDPARPIILPISQTTEELYQRSTSGQTTSLETRAPLDLIRPPPDPKSLVMPFWFGFKVVFGFWDRKRMSQPKPTQQAFPNSVVTPPAGVSWPLTIYLILFQLGYYGMHIGLGRLLPFTSQTEFLLWEVSNVVQLSLIAAFVLCLWAGSHAAPWLSRWLFQQEASSVLEVASLLPYWAKLLVHGPFVVGYILARVTVLCVALSTLRALPWFVYQDVNWSNFIPHI